MADFSRVETAKGFTNDVERLEEDLKRASDHLLPLMREYLKDVRGVRMAFAEEVRHIVEHVKQMREITSIAKDLEQFAESAAKLDKLLTPNFVERLRRITGE